jgi:dienelactone hydrolase
VDVGTCVRQDLAVGETEIPFGGRFVVAADDELPVAVVVLHGSDGWRRDKWATTFAEAGCDALAIKWFDESGIVLSPVETVIESAAWVAERTGKRVVVAGHSKGAELALVTAAYAGDSLAAVLGWAPSSVAWYGFNPKTWDPTCSSKSSWSLGGNPVPCLFDSPAPRFSDRGVVIRACYEAVLDDRRVGDAAIPIERFAGRVFLASGGDDQMWPSAEMAQMIVARMADAGREADVTHVCHPEAGHLITPDQAGNQPEGTDMGGSPAVDVEAAGAAWRAALDFLRAI